MDRAQTLGNHYLQTLNLSNFWFLLLCENENLPHTYSNDPWSMCSIKVTKRINLFNSQIDTLLKLVKIKYSYFPRCHGNTRNFMYRNFFDLVYINHF